MRKHDPFALCLILAMLFVTVVQPVSASAIENEAEIRTGASIYCDAITLCSDGYYVITERISQTVSTCASELPNPREQYKHSIYDRDGELIANFIATVYGETGTAIKDPCIVDISGKFTDSSSSQLSYKTSISGNVGHAYIYIASVKFATFNYRITSDGDIINY